MSSALAKRVDPLGDHGQRVCFALNTVFLVIGVLALGFRFVGRGLKNLNPGIDDYLCVLATVAYAAQCACVYVMIDNGIGGEVATLKPDQLVVYLKMASAVQFPYAVSMAAIRLSIVTLIMRIFTVTYIRNICWALIAAILTWFLYVVISAAVICRPFAFNWEKTLPGGVCGNQDTAYVAIAAVGIFLDLAIFLTPIPKIWTLNMGRGPKLALTGIFALGFFDLICGVMRLVVEEIGYTSDVTNALGWSIVEPGVAILVACAPIYRPIFQRIIPTSLREWASSLTSTLSLRGSKSSRSRTADSSKKYTTIDDDKLELTQNSKSRRVTATTKEQSRHDSYSATSDATAYDRNAGEVAVHTDLFVSAEEGGRITPRSDRSLKGGW